MRACNQKFLEVCRNFEPDVIALSTQDVLHAETLAQARRMLPNVAIFQYFIDPLFLDWNMRNVSSKADVVDWTFVTTGGPVLRRVAGRHSRAAYIPNPVGSQHRRVTAVTNAVISPMTCSLPAISRNGCTRTICAVAHPR